MLRRAAVGGRVSVRAARERKRRLGATGGASAERAITPLSEDYNKWFLDVIREAELADYGPVRGTMVIRPHGYAIWERVQQWLDLRFKEEGVENAYFPCFIPQSFLSKEAEHVEGFSPEVAVVTQAGGKELEEPLAVRPTSESIINHMFSSWVQSYRDLPMMVNQWSNAVRWELRPRPFLRTSEFLWQEGHTAHATAEEAQKRAHRMMEVYEQLARSVAALPVVCGYKSPNERFAGARDTLTMEAMTLDGRALQAGTSHDLADNFARAFGTRFLDDNGEHVHPHQTSWGVSTRFVGGVIMCHGDDTGLRLPPQLAPVQAVIVPILNKSEEEQRAVLDLAFKVNQSLRDAGIRCRIDDSTRETPGWKFNHWEMRGVPVRVEVGPKDAESSSCVLAPRTASKEGKQSGISVEPAELQQAVGEMLQQVHTELLEELESFRDRNIRDVSSLDELKRVIDNGMWARGPWAGSADDEKRLQNETGCTIRCFPFDQAGHGKNFQALPYELQCIFTGSRDSQIAIFAKSY